ncbi:hypothetical protein X792_04945 [Dehalococcoides mccartyi CG1]|jgi:hypothetical protein|uniref:hypothetical protein n=1 Tax=Dehalococcoides mccartyi TaxID=61435 RepID=UPI0004E074EB|nr:hypothetical protein [Dehalococcoides mccartyi]AII58719.1 hypothetical protein X792_04945 [Dehalococcoides mccartyi CG1]
MYEPSKELIEQIAKESWDNFWKDTFAANNKERYPNGIRVTYEEQKDATIAKNRGALSSPTILRALELYENQPKWQDKPDKTGWWWECHYVESGQFWISLLSPIAVNRYNDNNIKVCTDFEFKRWVPIDDYINKSDCRVKFMYLNRPEPYKGEE